MLLNCTYAYWQVNYFVHPARKNRNSYLCYEKYYNLDEGSRTDFAIAGLY